MKKIFYIISFGILLAACGQSYEETKRINRQQRRAAAQKDSAAHEAQIDRLSSYAEGVFLSRRVYNWCWIVFICSLIENVVIIILLVIRWI